MKERQTNQWIKPRKDSKGNLLCLVPTCNNLREKYKTSNNTRNYCKDHDYSDMRSFTSWPDLRIKAFKRDNWTCVKCGFQGESSEIYNKLIGDHIKPIALGGEEFDINNVQTLCVPCDKIKTRGDQINIAKQRRVEKILKKGQLQLP